MPSINTPAIASGARLLFWGILLVVVDISINHFDVLPDLLGALMIAVGMGRIAASHSEPAFLSGAHFCLFVSWLFCGSKALEVAAVDLGLLDTLLSLLWVFGAVRFCSVLSMLGERAGWSPLVGYWRTARSLCLWLWALPTCVATVIALANDGREVHLGEPVLAIALVVLIFVPLVTVLVGLSKTRREALGGVRLEHLAAEFD